MTCQCFLFDLDGTLVDTAPDLAAAVNRVRLVNHFEPMDPESLMPYASKGAPGLLGKAFGIKPDDEHYPKLRQQFFDFYQANCVDKSRVFDGIVELLEALRAQGIRCGVMTNKVERFAHEVLKGLGLHAYFDVIVGSDTEGSAMKPDPAGLLLAAQKLGLDPSACCYAGDDYRDIAAAQRVPMPVALVGWGYCADSLQGSGADYVAKTPQDLLAWVSELKSQ